MAGCSFICKNWRSIWLWALINTFADLFWKSAKDLTRFAKVKYFARHRISAPAWTDGPIVCFEWATTQRWVNASFVPSRTPSRFTHYYDHKLNLVIKINDFSIPARLHSVIIHQTQTHVIKTEPDWIDGKNGKMDLLWHAQAKLIKWININDRAVYCRSHPKRLPPRNGNQTISAIITIICN